MIVFIGLCAEDLELVLSPYLSQVMPMILVQRVDLQVFILKCYGIGDQLFNVVLLIYVFLYLIRNPFLNRNLLLVKIVP